MIVDKHLLVKEAHLPYNVQYLKAMEIEKKSDADFFLRTKEVEFAINPTKPVSAHAVIFTDPRRAADYDFSGLVISGPGEYEAKGVAIHGKRDGEYIEYIVSDGATSALITRSGVLAKVEPEEYDAVLVQVEEGFEEASFARIFPSIPILFGDKNLVPETESIKKQSKISLKRKEQYKDMIIYLG